MQYKPVAFYRGAVGEDACIAGEKITFLDGFRTNQGEKDIPRYLDGRRSAIDDEFQGDGAVYFDGDFENAFFRHHIDGVIHRLWRRGWLRLFLVRYAKGIA